MDGFSLLQDFATVLLVAGVAGWIFRRWQLSAVVGYLVAGIIIGPHTPPFALVTDAARIHTLTDLGLAFLMFFVGLGLSLQRIRRMGPGLVVATAITALLVYQGCQLLAAMLGWDSLAAFVFAAMMMTSSSAIISKMLAEAGLLHEPFARNALAMTVLEDIVAIVLLTLLGTRLPAAGSEGGDVAGVLFLLSGFAALLLVGGLLLVPRLLSRVSRPGDSDLHAVLVCGLVFLAGVASVRAGFSVALGPFLLGLVVAETRFRSQISKSLAGAQEMFSAIFFVSIGMLIDPSAFVAHLPLIVGVAAFALVLRTLAATTGFLVTGNPLALSLASAVVVTPIGEFAYVIARLGVDAGVVPTSFYAVAVGVSIITAGTVPWLGRRAEALGEGVARLMPPGPTALLARYRRFLEAAAAGLAGSMVWKLTSRRLGLAALQLVLLAGVFGFARPALAGAGRLLKAAGLHPPGWELAGQALIVALAVVVLVAAARSLQVLCLAYADALTMRTTPPGRHQRLLGLVLQGLTFGMLAAGVWIIFPFALPAPWMAGLTAAVIGLMAFLLRRPLAVLNARLESSLSPTATSVPACGRAVTVATTGEAGSWDLDMAEFVVPDHTASAGRSLRELDLRARFGSTVLEIDRQGFVLERVQPDERLFPGDRLLLLGTAEQTAQTAEFLSREHPEGLAGGGDAADFAESVLETVEVPAGSALDGSTLREARVWEKTGVQILGLERAGERLGHLRADQQVQAGDRLLVAGSAPEIRDFLRWLQG